MIRRRITPATLALCLTLALSLSAGATRAVARQGAPQTAAASGALEEALRLNDEAAKLFDAGRYVEAVQLAERALSLREKALGPDHPDVAVTLNLLGKLHRERADYAQAETLLKRALAIREKTPGPNQLVTAETLNDLAELYGDKADFTQAEPLLMRAVLIYSKVRGPNEPDPDAATSLNNLGMIYVMRGDIARGEVLCVNALNARMKTLGQDHRRTGESFDTIGTLFLLRGDLVNAEQYLQRALTVREKALGANHPDVAESLLNLSNLYLAKNDLARAEALVERARSIREKALGTEHPDYASSLIYLGRIYHEKGDNARAEQSIRRAISIREKTLGSDHILVADALQSLALIAVSIEQAEQLAKRVLAIREKAFGPDHMLVADSLAYLGSISAIKGDFMQAQMQYWRSASIRIKTFGPVHPTVAESFLSIANLLLTEGDTLRAGPMCGQAVEIYQTVFGPDHPTVAMALEKGGEILRAKGDYEVSERLLQRSLAIREKAFGPDHLLVADSLKNLALTTFKKGNVAGAEPLLERALSILEKSPERNQPAIIKILNNLAVLYNEKGDLPRAETTFRRAEAIVDKLPLLGNPELLNNRAILYMKMGDYAQAESLFAKSLVGTEKLFGGDHPNVAVLLVNMAGLYMVKGDYARAEEFLSRGEDVRERNLSLVFASGSERQKFSYLLTLSNETFQAVSLHTRMEPSNHAALRLSLTTILRRKGRALDTTTDQIASLRRRVASGEFKLLGANEIGTLDQLSATQSQLSSLILGGQRDLPPEQYKASLNVLGARAEQLQDIVSRLGAEFKQQPVTIEQVQQSLPPRAALVEFFNYRPYEPKGKTSADSFGPERYVVYVLRKEGDPLWFDIGDAASVDADLTRLLIALRCPQTGEDLARCPSVAEVKRLSHVLDERLMRPVRKLLGDTRHVFISPDGALNLLPFAALVDDSGKYLVENYSLTYLTSGRDLLRMKSSVESKEPPLILADPAFGKAGQPAAAATPAPAVAAAVAPTVGMPAAPTTLQPITPAPLPSIMPSILPPIATMTSAPSVSAAAPPRRSADFITVNFGPLPGSANEARTLAGLLPGARVLTQEQATEAALKQAHGPGVLHIATHGFFLPDQPAAPADSTLSLSLAGEDIGARVLIRSENPLLRSGLALAGANLLTPQGGGEDGILTALEATSLDLSGTKLVVLSACETGIGSAIYGEGVYGLRRALVLAGSESQVMSLWQVSDDATRDLMVGYYQRLLSGEGRTEALRQVQLAMLRSGGRDEGRQSPHPKTVGAAKADYSHPYYWAAFIQSGDWRSLNPRSSPTSVVK